MNLDFYVKLTTDKPFDQVTDKIEQLAPENQFRVLAVHNVQATLAEKGFERSPLKIIEVCNAGFAHEALKKSIDVALFMPCRYTVSSENGETVVKLARPTVISQMMPGIGLEELAADVEKRLLDIMEKAIG